jgi:hypothetical protein
MACYKAELPNYQRELGYEGEIIVANYLRQMDYKVYFPGTCNQPGFDLTAIQGHEKYMIQVKTDGNGDNIVKKPTRKQLQCLIDLAYEFEYTPMIIEYYPKRNTLIAYHAINKNIIDL